MFSPSQCKVRKHSGDYFCPLYLTAPASFNANNVEQIRRQSGKGGSLCPSKLDKKLII